MTYQGNLLKLKSLLANPIMYSFQLGGTEIVLNSLLGKEIHLHYLHQINCIRCGRVSSKSFAQGYCYPCFREAPETEECVLRPELCRAHEGIARDPEYSKSHCLIEHYVYLAFTSGLKVGVTRNTQIPIRWIDQGAIKAIKLCKTPNRYLAGSIEVALKAHYNDKTNWRSMLANIEDDMDLSKKKEEAINHLPHEFRKFVVNDAEVIHLQYPSIGNPAKFQSISLDKEPDIHEKLVGIKGQYLIFESGKVFNIRKHNGYLIELKNS